MADGDLGFVVTLRSVYDEVKLLSGQLQVHMAAQDTAIAVIQQRLAQAEGEIRQLYGNAQTVHERNEQERRHQSANRWMAVASILGSIALAVLTFVLRVPTH